MPKGPCQIRFSAVRDCWREAHCQGRLLVRSSSLNSPAHKGSEFNQRNELPYSRSPRVSTPVDTDQADSVCPPRRAQNYTLVARRFRSRRSATTSAASSRITPAQNTPRPHFSVERLPPSSSAWSSIRRSL